MQPTQLDLRHSFSLRIYAIKIFKTILKVKYTITNDKTVLRKTASYRFQAKLFAINHYYKMLFEYGSYILKNTNLIYSIFIQNTRE